MFNFSNNRWVIVFLCIAVFSVACSGKQAVGQRIRLPNEMVTAPPVQFQPASVQQGGVPNGTVGAPVFDPYGSPTGQFPPAVQGSPVIGNQFPGGIVTQPPNMLPPASTQPYLGAPIPGQSPILGQSPPPSVSFEGSPGFVGQPVYNPSLMGPPGGYSSGPSTVQAWPNQVWARLRNDWAPRLFEHPRFRHTYIGGQTGSSELGINESEIATTLTFPNFLWSCQPIRISPGFAAQFWNGPSTAVTGADLPPSVYSAYLAFDYASAWDRNAGIEWNVTAGVYSDFNHTTDDSIRLTGVGLGWFRFSNTTTFKLGVEYIDRVDLKLLPAVGLFVMPTNDMKLDLYFPRPKFAHRIPNVQNLEVWGYVGGEYGGGSWTIRRLGIVNDQVDLNDLRAFIGVEWLGRRNVTGFFEFGYVFNREILYRTDPSIKYGIDNAFMVRAGIAF